MAMLPGQHRPQSRHSGRSRLHFADSKDADYIECRIEALKSKVPGCSLGDDQLPNVTVDAPPNEGMSFKDAHNASDVRERLPGRLGRRFEGLGVFCVITAEFLSRSLAVEAESQYSKSPKVEFRRRPIAAGARLTSTMARAKCSDV
jgi:hypothetical protein